MPVCGRIQDYAITPQGNRRQIRIKIPRLADEIQFSDYIAAAFPSLTVGPARDEGAIVHRYFQLPLNSDKATVGKYLSLLQASVTIADAAADE